MTRYTGKTLDEALANAAKAKSVDTSEIKYEVVEEKTGFLGFGNQVTIEAYAITDVLEFLHRYLSNFFENIDVDCEVIVGQDSEGLKVMLNAENNAVLIGKAGSGIQAINTVVKKALQNSFKEHYTVLVDINNYKAKRYDKCIAMAVRIAKTVQRTKVSATLDPLPNDERKVIHQRLSDMPKIRTESIGQGKDRRLKIIYDAKKA